MPLLACLPSDRRLTLLAAIQAAEGAFKVDQDNMTADVFIEITNSIDEEAQGARPFASWAATGLTPRGMRPAPSWPFCALLCMQGACSERMCCFAEDMGISTLNETGISSAVLYFEPLAHYFHRVRRRVRPIVASAASAHV